MKILLQHKIFIGYFLLMAIIGSMVAIVLHERNRVQKIEDESIAISQTQHDINTAHRYVTALVTYGESVLVWDNEDTLAYRKCRVHTARDYLPKPVHRDYLLELAEDVFHPVATMRKQERQLFHRTSPIILKVEKFARLVAPSDVSVMILGANGTGKESVAQTIHNNSERYGKPFVAVNCGALPRELATSLFFGHEKGAFTGADTAKTGYFDLAKGGTLFLDEIGTMPHEIQSMLLRVLQENIYTPIGSGRERISDVRVISATNEDMELAIKEGRFREDLYHRLNEFEIRQPSLEECPEDIIPLAEFFRERFSKELKRATQGFTEETKQRMLAYRWPGNVRELQNRVKRAVLVSENPLLELPELNTGGQMEHTNGEIASVILPLKDEKIEKESIIKALQICNGHREQAVRLLKINPATLYRKMKKYGLR